MFRFTIRDLLWLTVVVALETTVALAEDVGSITGSVKFVGAPFEKLVETGSLPRDKSDAGIRWVAVFITSPVDSARPKAELAESVPTIHYQAGRFTDFVTPVQQGGNAEIQNDDVEPVVVRASGYDLRVLEVLHAKKRLLLEIPPTEKWFIDVHDVLKVNSVFVLPVPSPYFAVTREDGTFELKNVPVGKHSLRFWHPQIRSPHAAKRSGRPSGKNCEGGNPPISWFRRRQIASGSAGVLARGARADRGPRRRTPRSSVSAADTRG